MLRFLTSCLLAVTLHASPATLDRAEELYAGAEFSASLDLLESLPDKDAAAWALTGKSLYGLGEFKQAHQALEKAVDEAPETARYWLWLGRAYGQHADRANPFSAMGLARKCRDAFERAVELAPENIEALNDLFSYYLAAPGFLGGGVEKAEALAARVAKLDEAEHEYLQAELAKKRDDWTAAERHLRRALELEPERVGRRLDLASFLARRERIDESDRIFEKASILAPQSPKVIFARAKALIESDRDLATARQLLRNYLAADLTAEDPPRWEAEDLLDKAN